MRYYIVKPGLDLQIWNRRTKCFDPNFTGRPQSQSYATEMGAAHAWAIAVRRGQMDAACDVLSGKALAARFGAQVVNEEA